VVLVTPRRRLGTCQTCGGDLIAPRGWAGERVSCECGCTSCSAGAEITAQQVEQVPKNTATAGQSSAHESPSKRG